MNLNSQKSGDRRLDEVELYDERLARVDERIALFDSFRNGDLLSGAKLLLLAKEKFNGTMPPELVGVFESMSTEGVSFQDLQSYADGYFSHGRTEFVEQFLEGLLKRKMSLNEDDDREMVIAHQRYNRFQPLDIAYSRELRGYRAELKERILIALESVDQQGLANELVEMLMTDFLVGENQFIPDDLDGIIDGMDKPERSLTSRFHATGRYDSIEQLGLKKGPAKNARRQIDLMKANKKIAIYKEILKNLFERGEALTLERIEKMKRIAGVIMEGSSQFSEKFPEWLVRYSLAATSESNNKSERKFSFTTSLGGDQIPPAYPEAYLIEPLDKLQSLFELYEAGEISELPTFDIVSTAYSQLAENKKDHKNGKINAQRHIRNSLVTLARVQDFIKENYPQIADRVRIHLFPEYSEDGAFRMSLGALTANLELDEKDFDNLFAIKGKLQDNGEHTDPIENAFGREFNLYPARHLFSNGVLAAEDTLRFGADRTEAPFHLISTLARKALSDEGTFSFDKSISSDINYSSVIAAKRLLVEAAKTDWDRESVHAQLGMRDVHATYYRQAFDPSIEEIIAEGGLNPRGLEGRSDKEEKVLNTFSRVTDKVGVAKFIAHMKKWSSEYLDEVDCSDGDITEERAYIFANEIGLKLSSRSQTLEFLGIPTSTYPL